MRLFITFSLLFFGFHVNIWAQTEQDSVNITGNLSQSDAKIDLHLNLSTGDQYRYTTDYNQNIVQEIMGSSVEVRQEMTIDYHYEVESNTGDEIKIKAKYERLHINFEAPQGSFLFDSEESTQDEKLAKLNSIIGKPFYIYMNNEGKVTRVEDYEKLWDGLEMDNTIKNIFSDSMLMNSVDMNFYAPDPVGMGDSWNKSRSYNMGNLQLKSDLIYTLEGISEDLTWLNVDGNISALGSEEAYDMEFTGKQTGTLETDINTGMVSSGDIQMEIDAVIKSHGFEVPMKMNATISMSGTKL